MSQDGEAQAQQAKLEAEKIATDLKQAELEVEKAQVPPSPIVAAFTDTVPGGGSRGHKTGELSRPLP